MTQTLPSIIFLIVLNFFPISSRGQTTVAGGTVSGTWTKANSPYFIQGSIMISDGQTLSIEPGVKVEFQGIYKVAVLGQLLAMGTKTDTISFVAKDSISGWRGIRFSNTSTTNDSSKVMYCKFRYSRASGASPDDDGGALYFNTFSKALISNCQIIDGDANNRGGGIYLFNSDPIISNNIISNNISNGFTGGGGIYCEGSNSVISNNIISSNKAFFDGGGIHVWGGNPLIKDNTINNNKGFYGGGINISGNGNPTIINNLIINNMGEYGGGISGSTSNPISNNTITNNSANNSGGGIYSRYIVYKRSLINNIISNNTAIKGGGGFFVNPMSQLQCLPLLVIILLITIQEVMVVVFISPKVNLSSITIPLLIIVQ